MTDYATRSLFALALGLPVLLAAGPLANAQSQSGNNSSSYICMTRVGQASDGVVNETRVKVRQSEEQWLSIRGFARSDCGNAENWMRTTGPSMCALADVRDARFVAEFMNRHGLSPAEICNLSKALPAS